MGLLHDFRFAWRQLARNPGFALTAVVTLGLGIGAATTVFSEIDALYLKPLTVREPDRLVRVAKGGNTTLLADRFFVHEIERIGRAAEPVATISAHSSEQFALSGVERSESVAGKFVSRNYFDVLGARPAAGRLLGGGGSAAGEPGIVISHDLWQRTFRGDPRVAGRMVRLNGESVPILGVASREFNGVSRAVGEEVWIPIDQMQRWRQAPNSLVLVEVFARLSPGLTRAAAQEAMNARIARAENAADGSGQDRLVLTGLTGMPGRSVSGVRRQVLNSGAALLMLLLAVVNVAGMLLTRAETRRREIGVRVALGVHPRALVRQLLAESALLFTLGGVVGVLLATAAGALRNQEVWPPNPIRLTLRYGVDLRVLGFALGIALLTSVIFGLVPAIQVLRTDVASALRDSHGPTGRGGRILSALAVGQIATSLVLLAFTALLVRGLQRALSTNVGFDPSGVVAAPVQLGPLRYENQAARAFYAQVLERLHAIPRVDAASVTTVVPLSGTVSTLSVEVEGAGGRGLVTANFAAVTPGFFRTLAVPVVRGRAFNAADRAGSPPVAIVSAEAARRWWPGDEGVGKKVHLGPKSLEVVGVVRDVQSGGIGQPAGLQIYVPFDQSPSTDATILVRGAAAREGEMVPLLRGEVGRLEPEVPLSVVIPLRRLTYGSLGADRTAAWRIGALGLISLVVASVGIYGTLSYQVARRTREIGTRIALGARSADVLGLLMRRGLALVLAGLLLGVAASAALSGMVRHGLHGVDPMDPLSVLGAATVLLMAVATAVYLPARRAASMDAMRALRADG